MRETFELNVHLARDEESGRWFIAESDIPGLWLEAATATELMDRIAEAAPEMIQLNEAEIVANCRAKVIGPVPKKALDYHPRPKVRPVFDSPLDIAYA